MPEQNEQRETALNALIKLYAEAESGRKRLDGQIRQIDSFLCENEVDVLEKEPQNPDYAWWVGWALRDRKRLQKLLIDNQIDPETGKRISETAG